MFTVEVAFYSRVYQSDGASSTDQVNYLTYRYKTERGWKRKFNYFVDNKYQACDVVVTDATGTVIAQFGRSLKEAL